MSPVANNAAGELDGNALRKLLRRVEALFPASPSFRVVAGKGIVGKFYGATISSRFQTLLEPASGKVIGHQALARSNSANGSGLSPWGLFADSASDEHLIALDRLCRTIHALNFRASGLSAGGGTLLLEVHERLLHAVPHGHGTFFRQVLELIGVPPARIIIDIPPLQSSDVPWLRRVVGSYQSAGFGVAIAVTSALQAKLYATLLRPQWIRLPSDLVRNETVRALHALKVRVIAADVDHDGHAGHADHTTSPAHSLSAGVDMLQSEPYDLSAAAA